MNYLPDVTSIYCFSVIRIHLMAKSARLEDHVSSDAFVYTTCKLSQGKLLVAL